MKKILIPLIVIGIVVAVQVSKRNNPAVETKNTTVQEQQVVQSETKTFVRRDVKWSFVTKESEDEMLPPKTTVSFIAHGTTYNAGNYDGSCAEVASEQLEEGEIAGALCWFAGGGTEIGIFEENGTIAIKIRIVEEGNDEEAGFKGAFAVIAE